MPLSQPHLWNYIRFGGGGGGGGGEGGAGGGGVGRM